MNSAQRVPKGALHLLADARVQACFLDDAPGPLDGEGCARVDIAVDRGRITRIAAAGTIAEAGPAFACGGRQAWPWLVDMHTHLDKGHTAARTANPAGDFPGALAATAKDREAHWDAADLRRRMEFGLLCAEAHGVGAIRTHLDSQAGGPDRDQAAVTWAVFREMREAWAGRIALQGVGLMPVDAYAEPYGRHLADLVADSGGLLGGVTRPTGGLHGEARAAMDALLDHLFHLARERGLDIDLHVDETGDPAADSLDAVARATLRHGYEGRVTCGHCCSLALQEPEVAAATISRVAQAGIAIVTLPTVNLYLQDRHPDRTPRWRGVAPVKELRAAGVPVAVAGDNCRDGFHAYGDHDMLDTWRQAVRILHLDHPFADAAAMAGPIPADAMGLPQAGRLRVGAAANLVLLAARSLGEMVARPQADRIVIAAGRASCATPPPYEALTGETAPW